MLVFDNRRSNRNKHLLSYEIDRITFSDRAQAWLSFSVRPQVGTMTVRADFEVQNPLLIYGDSDVKPGHGSPE